MQKIERKNKQQIPAYRRDKFEVVEKSVPAYRFYQKNGFCELREHVSFAKQI